MATLPQMQLILNMILHLSQCLDSAELEAVCEAAANSRYHDGRDTAGAAAGQVKHNQQADSTQIAGLLRLVEDRLRSNDLFMKATYPAGFPRLILSRYLAGMRYGSHVDEALIDGQRTDISFTLFLSPPESYQGGELVLEDTTGERTWKLGAGDLLLYPATYLHRVNEVSEGERLVVVGWVTSRIRDAGRRESLFELQQSLHEEFSHRGKTEQFDRLSRLRNNLLRQWLDY